MSTSRTYSYALEKEASLDRGIQTLRGSHDIHPTEPVEVGHARQLLMDWHVVDDLNGCVRTVHQPRRHEGNPVIRAEEPYEPPTLYSFGTILREANGEAGRPRYRAWIPGSDALIHLRDPASSWFKRAHYYESDDGLTWRRPELGLVEYEGSTANNIFMRNRNDNFFVLPLPERMHDRGRYAMVYFCPLSEAEAQAGAPGAGGRNLIAFSDDGIHWNDAPENPVWCGRTDCGNNIVYNRERDVFMMYRRATVNAGEIRRIAYAQSRDLITWTQPITVVHREESDPLYLYSMHVSRYGGIYLGMLARLHSPADPARKLATGNDYQMDTELTWSRDGVNWQRHPLKPAFIPTSPQRQDAYDWGMAVGMSNLIEVDDHVRVYWGGREYLHKPGYIPPEDPRRGGICVGTLRRDGFVSVDAGTDGGYMLTRPLRYPGGALHLNARIAPGGFIKVAAREAQGSRDGEWPERWRFEHAVPVEGDSLDHTVAWEHGPDLADFPGGAMRLHFWMEQAELYAFWFGD